MPVAILRTERSSLLLRVIILAMLTFDRTPHKRPGIAPGTGITPARSGYATEPAALWR